MYTSSFRIIPAFDPAHIRQLAFVIFIAWLVFPAAADANGLNDNAYKIFEEATQLRADGEFERAADAFIAILEERLNDEVTSRRAYVEIVFTLLLMEQSERAEQYAREALLKFPDLSADPTAFPSNVRDFLEGLKRRLFGSLILETDPPGCRVLIKDYAELIAPVVIENVPVGQYETIVSGDGYRDKKVTLDIDSEKNTFLAVKLVPYNKFGPGGFFRPGLDIGVNYVYLGGAYKDPYKTKFVTSIRFSVGVFVDIGVKPRFFIEPGIRFVRLGSGPIQLPGYSYSGLDLIGPVTESFAAGEVYLDYLSIPLLLKYYVFGPSGLYVLAGPEIGILLRASQPLIDQEHDVISKNNTDRYNVAINGGFGYKLGPIFLGISLSVGLNNVLTELSGGSVWRTREIKLSTGFVY